MSEVYALHSMQHTIKILHELQNYSDKFQMIQKNSPKTDHEINFEKLC